MKRVLESKIEQFRNEEAGLAERVFGRKSEGDHPVIVQLQNELQHLQDSIDRIENAVLAPGAAWSNHNARILDWIRTHEPELLKEK